MAGGNFVIAWSSSQTQGMGSGIYAQRYDSSENKQGGQFKVNSFSNDTQSNPCVAADAAGNFVIAWKSSAQNGLIAGIFAQRYDNNGMTVGSEFQVNSQTTGSHTRPACDMDAIGDFVVTWQSALDASSEADIDARCFQNNGTPKGNDFQINSHTTAYQVQPQISMDEDGDFTISWTDQSGNDGDGNGVFAQHFDPNGDTIGGEFLVNTFTTGFQDASSVAVDVDGDVVIAWSSFPQDGSEGGVYLKNFDCCAPEFTVANATQLTGRIINNTYQTAGNMESLQVLDGGETHYDAANCIELLAGFEVVGGTVFRAFIDGCGVN